MKYKCRFCGEVIVDKKHHIFCSVAYYNGRDDAFDIVIKRLGKKVVK